MIMARANLAPHLTYSDNLHQALDLALVVINSDLM